MSGLTTWSRLEPHAQTNDLDAGLAAEIADPVWLLSRQLSLGEFAGDDGGTPVGVHVRASWSRLTRLHRGPLDPETPAPAAVPFDARRTTLEAAVEGEPTVPHPADAATSWPARVHGGRLLTRALAAAGEAGVAAALLRLFPFTPPDSLPAAGEVEVRYRTVFAGRAVDGVRVRLDLRDRGALHPEALAAASSSEAVAATVAAWAEAADRLDPLPTAAQPSTGGSPAWVGDRVEYAFAVAAPGPGGTGDEVVLAAREYEGTGVDWFTADVMPGVSLGAAADAGAPGVAGVVRGRMLPAPLRYPGQPADRFWEMEDARVDLGAVGAGPTDIARMLAVEYALVYGPDWYLVPLELPTGAVARVDWVVVRDTFGAATVVGRSADAGADRAGRQFQPASTADGPGVDPSDVPLLLVPPAGTGALRGPVLEHLLLQRDELANLAWGIERTVLGAAGRPLDRSARVDAPVPDDLAGPVAAELVWRLSTPVPGGWVPLVAVRRGDAVTGATRLVRAVLDEGGGDTVRAPAGQLLAELDELAEEEVTSAGRRVRLLDQRARAVDGSTVVWRGRETGPGGGEVRSRLAYDRTEPPAG